MAIWLKGSLVLFWSYDKHSVFTYLYDTDKVKKKERIFQKVLLFSLYLTNIEYLSCINWREGAKRISIDPTLKLRDKWKHLLLTLELAHY